MTNLEKLKLIVSHCINNFSFLLTASDTHRWVDPDGFYEVQFDLFEPDNALRIYLTTVTGGQDLEDEWYDSELRSTDWNEVDFYFDENKAKYALNEIKNNLPEYLYEDELIIEHLFNGFYTGNTYINSDNVQVIIEDIDYADKTNVGFSCISDDSIDMTTIKEFLTEYKYYKGG